MVTLYCDVEYASKEKVETTLWTMHVMLNSAYRKVRDKYEKQQKMVTKRSIEKLYETFIKTLQMFYKAHLQRLCAVYPDLPELQRLVVGGVVDRFEGFRDTARIDAVAAGVKKQVLTSAYLTLNYLGDLWRYRTQLKHAERRKYDAALAYYRLATDLDPRSGYAYHQMGVIFLEQDKHFDIVYHFYRSLAAEEPHPNAAKNLESEFNRVLKASASPRGQGPHQALQDWVVRLQAHFYLGKTFSQHAELEDEVLHRLGLAVKAHDFVAGLLKIALINICAYQVAKERITGRVFRQADGMYMTDVHTAEWTAEKSQTCQFTLRLNIRTIHAVLLQLQPELLELVDHMKSATESSKASTVTSSTKDGSQFSALISDALPLLRVYMTWLCKYRTDIVQFEPHLRPHVEQMYESLSTVLSSLFEVLRLNPRMHPVPYLFPEDMEALGLKALSGPAIPPACLLGNDPITRTPKSRPEEAGKQEFALDDISFTRALDITTCGFVLADDQEFPLAITETRTTDGHFLVKVAYLGRANPPSPAAAATQVDTIYASRAPAVAGLAAVLGVQQTSGVAAGTLTEPALSAKTPTYAGAAKGFAEALTLHGEQQLSPFTKPTGSVCPPQLVEEANYAVDHDTRMNDLVNGLVEPSESDVTEAVQGQNESSYGMHTATARDVFGSAVPSTSPGMTPAPVGLNGHPWGWNSVTEPAPHHRGISSSSTRDAWPPAGAPLQPASNRNSSGGVSQHGLTNTNNPFGPIGGTSGHQAAPGSTYSSGQGSWGHARQHSYGTGGISTTAGNAGQASYGYAASTNNPWNQSSSKFSSIQDILGAQLGALVPGSTGARPLASTPAPNRPAVPSSFASTNFSGATSSLPPVNSPWGIPNRSAVGSNNDPGPISRPPASNDTSRPSSNASGSGVGSSTWRRNNGTVPDPVSKPPRSGPNSGPTTPGLSAAPANGTSTASMQQPVQGQTRDAAYEAMLRKLQKPKS
jgi:hypothetical protein